jgi:hypothetical protein
MDVARVRAPGSAALHLGIPYCNRHAVGFEQVQKCGQKKNFVGEI